MKNTFGSSLQVTIFGESHGPYIGAVLDGLAPGIEIDDEYIKSQLTLRRPAGKISTARVEADEYEIVSGVFNGFTTGTPLTIIIPNKLQHSKDYANIARIARPGHADYTAYCKYHGYEDFRGGGHFSGRITAAIVAAGAICEKELKNKGIFLGTHIKSCGNICDRDFINIPRDITEANNKSFAVLDDEVAEEMLKYMESVAAEGDSVGGVLETAIVGMPQGVGEPMFDTIEGVLAHGLFAIPAIKGVQFGAGFDMVNEKGSTFNDPLRVMDGVVYTETNHNGGINGGITNGASIVFRCAVKPTPSIYKQQRSVDFINKTNEDLVIEGRHDPAIIHRARVVVDSMTAIMIYDILAGRFGTDFFGRSKKED